MDEELNWLSATELRQRFIARTLSPVELARHVLRRIETIDGRLNAFITVDESDVMRQARHAEQALFENESLGPLHGVPIPIKDSIPTRGLRTTYGSLLYADLIPTVDAIVVQRLRQAGAIILGKTSVPEFQVAGRTRNRLSGECFNPWDMQRSAGGSSGGSAASVAAGIAPVAIGGDDGGSIRLPSSYCGLLGICPSAGRIPRLELPPEGGYPGFVFQNIGPMARTVADAVTVLQVIAGPHASDPYAMQAPPPGWLTDSEEGVSGLRAAWVTFPEAAVEPAIEATTRAAAQALADLGLQLDDPDLSIDTPWSTVGTLTAAYLDDFFDGIRRDPARRQLITPWTEAFLAAPVPDADTERKAWAMRHTLMQKFNRLFDQYDVLLTPTTGRLAPQVDDSWDLAHPTNEYAAATITVNALGLSAGSIPCGFVNDMPVGLQVIARRGGEATVLRVARALETAQPWSTRRPDAV